MSHSPGALRTEALRILARVEDGAWPDRLLQQRENAFADSRDRRFLHLLVIGTLRWQGALDPRLSPLVKGSYAKLRPHLRAALRLGLFEVCVLEHPVPIAVNEAVAAVGCLESAKAGGLVNAVLRRATSAGRPPLDPRLTIPPWLAMRWDRAFGKQRSRSLINAVNLPGRPFLVARSHSMGRDELARVLTGEGITTEPSERHPRGLRVLSGAPGQTEAYRKGAFVILDEAAALVAQLACPADPRPALDLAAAPGGKAALLAAECEGGLVALDVSPTRARLLHQTLRRFAPEGRCGTLLADGTQPPLAQGSFSLVLVDAPCSGSGTLRGRPDKRLRLKERDIFSCAKLQRRLLEAACTLVGDGGSLVYAVCSIEAEEGQDQVSRFLERHPEFEAQDPISWLGKANEDLVSGSPPLMRSLPDQGEVDGFVAARLIKTS